MDKSILEKLYATFTLSERKGAGGKIFKYVPSEDIVDRMNKVFRGQWSTEVREKEILEDQILLCVRVYVRDPMDIEKMYWHDGYASHPIARYTSGPNNGKAIDIGNSFKSAMSKAIKTAVSKWGVALYLDGEVSESPSSFMDAPFSAPQAQESVPVKASVAPNMPDFTPAVKPIEAETVSTKTVNSLPMGFPPTANATSKKEASSFAGPSISPFSTVENMEAPESFAPDNSEDGELCTPVQQVAITTVMESHNLAFGELAKKALKREDSLPETIEKLKYTDAVKLIQYGNELSKVA